LGGGKTGTEGRDLPVQLATQILLDVCGGLERGGIGEEGDERPRGKHCEHTAQEGPSRCQTKMENHDTVNHMCEQPGLDDQQQPAARADAGGGGKRHTHSLGPASEPAIERLTRRQGQRGGMGSHNNVISRRGTGKAAAGQPR
jgi:hypothetical protein